MKPGPIHGTGHAQHCAYATKWRGGFQDAAGKWHTVEACDGHRADLTYGPMASPTGLGRRSESVSPNRCLGACRAPVGRIYGTEPSGAYWARLWRRPRSGDGGGGRLGHALRYLDAAQP
jgi:hypothetical protein